MRRAASFFATSLAAASLATLHAGCGEECYIFPTSVELELSSELVEAPAQIFAIAHTELGTTTCGEIPSEVVAYHWRLDGEPLTAPDGGPLGRTIVVELEEPGVHEIEVRVEDDVGREIPYVGRASVLAY